VNQNLPLKMSDDAVEVNCDDVGGHLSKTGTNYTGSHTNFTMFGYDTTSSKVAMEKGRQTRRVRL